MTDRIHALTVVLDRDYRDDDVQAIVQAILMIKGVIDVRSHVTDPDDYAARARIKSELGEKFLNFYKEIVR